MAVQARFFVDTITKKAYQTDQVEVTLKAAGRGPENKSWQKYTPSGDMRLVINNPSAAAWFDKNLGKDVAITFEERPVVCAQCHEEIPMTGEHQQPPTMPGTGPDDGKFICVPCLTKSKVQ